jgi:hypothetical protein
MRAAARHPSAAQAKEIVREVLLTVDRCVMPRPCLVLTLFVR